ncbi:neuronal acetylcholine receptor subunit non-alpha-3 [Caerostris extrusa]|uniref:Neuronal acetylcholine receptor subunit non-alpha-3 n=1 Tax=Caerostris extrusa TaxID=172846 RepID=A0AAV4T104_CAEEX|nr:neuronal acetylcholine receptor subunit non-alpha-3 [Caerostris extrusa]
MNCTVFPFSVAKTNIYDAEDILPVQVYSNGTMKWYPPTAFDIPCSAKYRHYPFDSHNCSMLFGAWTHRGSQINLRTLKTSTIIRYVCVVPTLIVFLSSIAGFWLSPNDGSRFLIGCSNIIFNVPASAVLSHDSTSRKRCSPLRLVDPKSRFKFYLLCLY